MVQINQLTIALKNGKKIVDKLSFCLNEKDKCAIIGEEGNGKSTLIKYLVDPEMIRDYCDSSGSISLLKTEIGYLPQIMDIEWIKRDVLSYFLQDNPTSQPNYDFYEKMNEAITLFNRLDLDDSFLSMDKIIGTLSGGEVIKLELIKLMLNHPKLLILDEPTNDIDLKTIEFLENFMNEIDIPILYVSHDETLLEKTANIILHLEQIKRKTEMKFTYIKIGYRDYVNKRMITLQKQDQDAYRTHSEKDKKIASIARQHLLVENDLDRAVRNPSWGRLLAKKMANIKAMEKRIDKIEVVDYAQPEEAINFFFDDSIKVPKGKVIIDLKMDSLGYPDYPLAKSIELKVMGPTHVGIVGKNGAGKTTLLRIILEDLKKTKNIHPGYMPQSYDLEMNRNISSLEFLQESLGYDKDIQDKIMCHLGALNFMEYEMKGSIMALSGGEKAKLYLLRLVLAKNDVLVLDEPTRNLSPLSNPVIRKILHDYQGTILSISHDRLYLKEVCDEIYELTPEGLRKRTKEEL